MLHSCARVMMLHRAPVPALARRAVAQCRRTGERRGMASASVAEGFVESAALVSDEAKALAEYGVDKGIHAPSCRISTFPNAGYGIQAAHSIEAGDTVLRVPQTMWRPFSADQAVRIAQERAPDFVKRIESLASALSEQDPRAAAQLVPSTLLAVHTLFLASDRSGDWHAFTDFLPRHVDVPLHWQPEEVELLRGTDAYHQVAKRRSFVSFLHRHLFEATGAEKETTPGIRLAQFAWAQSVLLSRATSGEDRPFTLLPVIDCLNHSFEPNARILFDDATQDFAVEALRAIAEGEEVVVSYGDLDSSTLLRQYGFLLDSSPHARVAATPVFLPGQTSEQCAVDALDPDAEDTPLTQRKRELLARHGCGPGTRPPITRAAGVDGTLRDVLTILCLTEEDLEEGDPTSPSFPSSLRRPALLDHVHACALATVGMRLRGYPATFEEDVNALHASAEKQQRIVQSLQGSLSGAEGADGQAEVAEEFRRARREGFALLLRCEEQQVLSSAFLRLQEDKERTLHPDHRRAMANLVDPQ